MKAKVARLRLFSHCLSFLAEIVPTIRASHKPAALVTQNMWETKKTNLSTLRAIREITCLNSSLERRRKRTHQSKAFRKLYNATTTIKTDRSCTREN